ncbi:uncharacterized protein N7458_006807 [Penicillium daleae]|uniref:2-dehydropantoate 2-reductase n=1 Tax=Penicillium daleae TaxID=63821 RepID=A0AAD6G2W9_9EURO|nr:uncharacterized protein N7458_006807 [Penicillium daleae]KAJ5450358.1 hypothetical protein N7458_006807 [Penicillium daleae]
MPSPTQSIHILGLGSIGSFLAHSIRALPNPPPVRLLIHRKTPYDQFASKGFTLSLRVNDDGPLQEQSGFGAELLSTSTSSEPIQNLIVAVKASATVSALQPIQHRLGPQSTICLFQNGMGQIEDLNERVFTDEARRPTYMFGIMRHGVYLRSPTEAILSGLNGRAAIGVVEDEERTGSKRADPQFLLDTLLRSPILHCEQLAWNELLQNQLFKLAANCVLNPLTAILDVRNGVIKENPDLQPLIRRLLREISLVFQSLPEIRDLPSDQKDRFAVASLESLVMDTIEKTAGNSSSMREDVRKGRATEIEYINGWVLRRARELGIECEANAGLMQLVLAKSRLSMGS